MSDTFEELVKHLLEHSIRTGDFTLKSGRKSTWFCDAKQTACRPEGILLIADAALEIIPDDITAIGGLTAGADPVAFGIAAAILIESGLSFLGIGVPDDIVTWGSLLNLRRQNLEAWWLIIYPGLAIFLTITIYNMIAEASRDALDPRLKS